MFIGWFVSCFVISPLRKYLAHRAEVVLPERDYARFLAKLAVLAAA
jgi:hypothetical protein